MVSSAGGCIPLVVIPILPTLSVAGLVGLLFLGCRPNHLLQIGIKFDRVYWQALESQLDVLVQLIPVGLTVFSTISVVIRGLVESKAASELTVVEERL